MRNLRPYAFIIMVMFIIAGCGTRHGDFTVLSSKLIRLSDFELEKVNRVKGVEGKSTAQIIFVIPTAGDPSLEDAIDEALEKGNGDVMTDAVIYSWGWYIPYIYGSFGWRVKGDVIKTRKY